MKKIWLSTALTLGLFLVAGIAYAQVVMPNQRMLIDIGEYGNVTIHGTISSISPGLITVKSWGGIWRVTVSASTQIQPKGSKLSSFRRGDFVGIQGTINQNLNWTIDGTSMRDWALR